MSICINSTSKQYVWFHQNPHENYRYILGNAVVKCEEELSAAFEKLGGSELYAEKWVLFVKELAVMVVQTQSGIHVSIYA